MLCTRLFHSRFWSLKAVSARLKDADRVSRVCVVARVAPSVNASSVGMGAATVDDWVENVSSALSQSSPLA